jgi:hypothetical protein
MLMSSSPRDGLDRPSCVKSFFHRWLGVAARCGGGRRLVLERLEARCCPAAIVMSDYEQLLLELVNRARSNPAAEAAFIGIDLNEGLPAGTITPAPKQPLAPHQSLVNAAAAHSQDMLDRDFFEHHNPEGKSPPDRMNAAGYPGMIAAAENIAWSGRAGIFGESFDVINLHEGLFDSPGHRRNLLGSSYREAGTGVRFGTFTSDFDFEFDAIMMTENFAARGGTPFITGVVYSDLAEQDQFYSLHEGIGNVTITAVNGQGTPFSTDSGPSGGYSIQVPAGTYTVTAAGPAIGSAMIVSNIVVGTENRKVDFVPALQPEIIVELNGNSIADGTPAAIEFGSVVQGQAGSSRTFTVRNIGAQNLTLGAVNLPLGFLLIEGLTSSLPPGGSDAFTVRLESSAVGAKGGELSFATNDTDENPFNYAIAGSVTAPPTPPTISDIANQVTNEDTSSGSVPFTIGDLEFAATQLIVSAGSSDAALIPVASVVLGGSGANRTLTITPALNQSGSATITVTVTDPSGLSISDSILLTVTPVNDAPTIAPIGDQFIVKNGSRTVSFVVRDVETPTGQLTVTASASNELVVPPGGLGVGGTGMTRTVALEAAAGQEGTATVTVRVSDGQFEASRSFTVWVLANPYPWHNTVKAMDVNNSNTIEPLDALLVINYLNAGFSTTILPTAAIGGLPGFGWIDTNASNEVAPLDALMVINALNAGAAGEGEGQVQDGSGFGVQSSAEGKGEQERERKGEEAGGSGLVGEVDLMALLALDVVEEAGRRRRGR